jgi:AcrR family transcriptional regulator
MVVQDLPPGLDVLWGDDDRPRRARRGGLTVERIVETAVALADEDGLEAVSMARVAERLGFTPMALYRHVRSKDELLVLMQDAAIGPPPPLDEDVTGWRPQLERWCLDLLAVVNRHPWWLRIPASPPAPTPNHMAWLDRGLRAMEDTGLAEADKAAIMLMLNGVVNWEARLTAELSPGDPGDPLMVYVRVAASLVGDERFPSLSRAVAAGIFEDASPDEDFWFSLQVVLDGIERLVEAAR